MNIEQARMKNKKNHRQYIKVLRAMSSQKKLKRAFELSDFTRKLFLLGLHRKFPERSEKEIKNLYLERIDKCHNRNY